MTTIVLPDATAPATAGGDHRPLILHGLPLGSLRLASAIALAVIAVLNLADIVTTRIMLAHGAIESNPLAALLLPHGRVDVVKAVVIAMLAIRIWKRTPRLAVTAALWFGAGFYFLTVVSNLLIIQRLG